MSKYVDTLIKSGFTLEELYNKGVIDEIVKDKEIPNENKEIPNENKEIPNENKDSSNGNNDSSNGNNEIQNGNNDNSNGNNEIPNENVEYITKEYFESAVNELKKTIISNNIKNSGTDSLTDDKQITIDEAINGLYYGGK